VTIRSTLFRQCHPIGLLPEPRQTINAAGDGDVQIPLLACLALSATFPASVYRHPAIAIAARAGHGLDHVAKQGKARAADLASAVPLIGAAARAGSRPALLPLAVFARFEVARHSDVSFNTEDRLEGQCHIVAQIASGTGLTAGLRPLRPRSTEAGKEPEYVAQTLN